ncbi:MAG: helix-turn-helix domain-containing protein [Clostridia bacterium]|nr:helix-turn-helix domain-containing protein [Clostridia bacterium]
MIENNLCDINFENFEKKIRVLFSTKYLLNCYKNGNEYKFREVFEDKKIKKILNDPDMLYSIDNFFKNNLKLMQTSHNSYMHRNTLGYRLEKIKKATGLNIKIFEDAVILNNLLLVFKELFKK